MATPSNPSNWTPEQNQFILENFSSMTNKQLADKLGVTRSVLNNQTYRLGLRRFKRHENPIEWTEEMKQFLIRNYQTMSNRQLADALGVKVTQLRNQTFRLGLIRYHYENWTEEETEFLKNNYQVLGDIEILDWMMANRPDRQPMQRKAIRKKRLYLGLKRTPEQIEAIKRRHFVPGGRSYTINENSGSAGMKDGWVANMLSRDGMGIDHELRAEVLQHPELLDLKRNQIKLKRVIRGAQNAKNK